MDRQRFDEFTRLLGAGRSRREAVKLLLGGAAGVAAIATAGGGALAQAEDCPGEGDSCENTDCCDGFTCNDDLVCTAEPICGGEGDSCENQDCCEGYGCNADLVCEASGGACGLEGDSCENQDCCDGLVCSDDLTCLIPDDGAEAGSDSGTTLPATGIGGADGSNAAALIGLAVAGGAALGAAALTRRQRTAE